MSSNLQQSTLSQLPAEVWSLMIAPVSKNTITTMPIEDAKQFVIESYLLYRKRAAELAKWDYFKAYKNWDECKKNIKKLIKVLNRDQADPAGLIVQYEIERQRVVMFETIKKKAYKTYKDAYKNENPITGLNLLAASYGREHKIKKPFEIAAWQRVFQAEGKIRTLEYSLFRTERELRESLVWVEQLSAHVAIQNKEIEALKARWNTPLCLLDPTGLNVCK